MKFLYAIVWTGVVGVLAIILILLMAIAPGFALTLMVAVMIVCVLKWTFGFFTKEFDQSHTIYLEVGENHDKKTKTKTIES